MRQKTLSAIFGSHWLIQKEWANAHMPLVASVLKGNKVDFGFEEKLEGEDAKNATHFAGSVYNVRAYTDLSMLPGGSIAMVTIAGPILKYGDYCAYGTVDYTRLINRLAVATNIAGIILNTDTPGGQAAGTAAFADAIKIASTYKPVIAVIDDGYAASAGMWIISAATEIYVTQPTDMVGSVGVYTTIMDVYAYLEAQGLQVRDIYAPQSTDKNQDYIQALKGNDEPLKAELKVLASEFIKTIEENRSEKLANDDWKTGKMFHAKDAEKIGLIDGIKSMSEVIDRMDELTSKKSRSNNNNNAQTQTNHTMKFPTLSKLLGLKAEDNVTDVKLEDNGQTLETALTERDSLQAKVTELEGTIATQKTEIGTLTTAKSQLETKVSELEGKVTALEASDGAELSDTSKEKDVISTSTDLNANDLDFQKELFSKM